MYKGFQLFVSITAMCGFIIIMMCLGGNSDGIAQKQYIQNCRIEHTEKVKPSQEEVRERMGKVDNYFNVIE
ncbi:hypothetical protein C9J48_13380 [Photobacterium profundum]|uniref:Uncharacterized protein n=1 Tax=Photobacterium profundum 3TCK TaxID=314280 RepID=Q1Z3D3_9GAMM|nr:hypothetical protein [Photobacterium profundum]EAS43073.1 hypothetical protein P3TCK_11524 [Photobacterium profundum 3TCK]PSV61975.1 hypothetical protein C9J48_13380 [Photobacterium profundum]